MMKNFNSIYPVLFIILLVFSNANATEYYVSPGPAGNNSNDGLSPGTPFLTIQKAADESAPDDTVWVTDGTYNEEVVVANSGNPDEWISFKSVNFHGAKVTNTWYNCFTVKANYIMIDGFDLSAPAEYGSGFGASQGYHHLKVSNCYAHDCGQSGIATWDNDYITIENNICTRNAWLMPYAGSGISVYGAYKFDNDPGPHIIVRNNISFNNDNGPETAMTDGNGIIIDDLMCTQDGHDFSVCTLNAYDAETLVEGNLCFDNGGKGIQVYLAENITVRNNTCFWNTRREDEGTWRGEIAFSNVNNIQVNNNIAVCNTDMGFAISSYNTGLFIAQYGSHSTKKVIWKNNLTYNTANPNDDAYAIQVSSSQVQLRGNLFGADPLFNNSSIDSALADFSLQEESPAIDMGTTEYGFFDIDLAGNFRVMGASIDMGCYEVAGENPVFFNLNVINGSGSGYYTENTLIDIQANDAPDGQGFDHWTGDIEGIEDVNSAATAISITGDAEITATYIPLEVRILSPGETEAVLVYPNPASTNFSLGLKKNSTPKQIKLCNSNGEMLLILTGKSMDKIDVTDFEDGLYLIQISLDNGKQLVHKIIVHKSAGPQSP